MTTVAKRHWGPQRSLSEGVTLAIDWLEKAKQKNVLTVQEPKLYQAYLIPPIDSLIEWGKPLSEIFRWTNKDTPAVHRYRDAALRLLAVAFKTHFFMARKYKIAHEPYLFAIPDISTPQNIRYGLIYKLDGYSKTIIVGELDLGKIASLKVRTGRFPVVLIDDNNFRYKWFNIKYWKGLSESGSICSNVEKTWANKKNRDEVNSHTDIDSFNYGNTFDIPYSLKEMCPELGMEWAKGIKRWYLPTGFDVPPVKVFVDYMIEKSKTDKNFNT